MNRPSLPNDDLPPTLSTEQDVILRLAYSLEFSQSFFDELTPRSISESLFKGA
jgi:hypothetical protein